MRLKKADEAFVLGGCLHTGRLHRRLHPALKIGLYAIQGKRLKGMKSRLRLGSTGLNEAYEAAPL